MVEEVEGPFCYGSALARAALVPIGLGLASLGFKHTMLPVSYFLP